MKRLAFSLLVAAGCGNSTQPVSMDMAASTTIHVKSGGSIQAALDAAQNGYTVEVEPGTYNEELSIDKSRALTGLKLIGLVSGADRPILDGKGALQNGLFAAALSGFTMQGFTVKNYKQNGVWVGGGSKHLVFRDITVDQSGKYGIFPQDTSDVLVENCEVTRVADAGIYVGQSTGPLVVQHNKVHENVAGIECENSDDCDIHDNDVYGNSGGILAFVLPHLLRKTNLRAHIHDNLIHDNNTTNFAAMSDIVAKVPTGGGVTVFGIRDAVIEHNTITGNNSFAVAVISLTQITGTEMIDVMPDPVNDRVINNTMSMNGTKDFSFMGMTFPAGDFAYDGTGSGDCQSGNGIAMPRWVLAPLPTCM